MRSIPLSLLPIHQLPDAPPPPALAPPPRNPPLSLDPDENDPPPPKKPPPLPPDDAMLSLNNVNRNATTPATPERIREPAASQNSTATATPVAAEPISLPSRLRSMPPKMMTPKITNGLNGSSWLKSPEPDCCRTGAGSGSP